MNAEIPANKQIIRYLTRHGDKPVTVATPDSIADPYMCAGSHPDIVERLWDGLGAAFPPEARCLFCGTPALIHPATGIVFGLGLGTQYGLRLPLGYAAVAVSADAKTFTRWSTGETMDTHQELGEEWVFGAWLPDEPEWCMKAYEFYSTQ